LALTRGRLRSLAVVRMLRHVAAQAFNERHEVTLGFQTF